MFSHAAMDQVLTLRRRLNDFLGEYQGIHVTAQVAGANAESADIRASHTTDQVQSWFVVPIGVFLVLIVALRDPLACLNLVATMVLTYAFALGATHLVFVTLLGAEGLDWKVPYFLFVLLIAVGVDYNVFLMARLHEESQKRGLRDGIIRAIGQTGGLISSAAVITASSFASFLFSPLGSLRQLGFALVVGILIDAILVRPLLVPCGHWLLHRTREALAPHRVIRKGTAGILDHSGLSRASRLGKWIRPGSEFTGADALILFRASAADCWTIASGSSRASTVRSGIAEIAAAPKPPRTMLARVSDVFGPCSRAPLGAHSTDCGPTDQIRQEVSPLHDCWNPDRESLEHLDERLDEGLSLG